MSRLYAFLFFSFFSFGKIGADVVFGCGRVGIENDRLRHIRLHERVNELPDPNYAALKFLMGHLDKCVNFFPSRSSSNLGWCG